MDRLLKLTLLLACCVTITIATQVFGQDVQSYQHGHQALQIFDDKGMAAAPTWVKIWIGFMALSFFSGILFIKNHSIARWVVGGFVIGLIASKLITTQLGLQPLSGLIALYHLIFWTPALILLLKHRPFLNNRSAFGIWSGVMTFVILFSFIFDLRDAAIYLHHVLS